MRYAMLVILLLEESAVELTVLAMSLATYLHTHAVVDTDMNMAPIWDVRWFPILHHSPFLFQSQDDLVNVRIFSA